MMEITKCTPQLAIKNDLNNAFRNFIAKRSGFPRFHKKGVRDSFEISNDQFTQNLYRSTIREVLTHSSKTEALPYAPDAWVDGGMTQIGYEISFTKHFYKPVQLRELSEIIADIRALEKETEGLFEEVLAI